VSKERIKLWLDANIHDGEDRSGEAGDRASFGPDELQALVEECLEDIAGWISVKDRLPEEEGEVWVCYDGKSDDGYYFAETLVFDADHAEFPNVTHWCPKTPPSPPKEESE
jgi:hypothetical protein